MLILLCSSVLSDGVCLSELKGLLTYLLTYSALPPKVVRRSVFTRATE